MFVDSATKRDCCFIGFLGDRWCRLEGEANSEDDMATKGRVKYLWRRDAVVTGPFSSRGQASAYSGQEGNFEPDRRLNASDEKKERRKKPSLELSAGTVGLRQDLGLPGSVRFVEGVCGVGNN
jgi:hypothetical protein